MKFKTIDDRTASEHLVGSIVFIDGNELATPSKGSYFVHDVIGCEVWTDDGRNIGIVEEIYPLATQDIWGIRSGTKMNLIPAVKEFVKKVDIGSKMVVVHLIDGLIEQ